MVEDRAPYAATTTAGTRPISVACLSITPAEAAVAAVTG